MFCALRLAFAARVTDSAVVVISELSLQARVGLIYQAIV
jgi:hypothetical protein